MTRAKGAGGDRPISRVEKRVATEVRTCRKRSYRCVSHSRCRRRAILIGLGVAAAAPAYAGTVMPDPLLATIGEVDLYVSAALAFEPIPGLDIDALETEIRDRCRAALEQTRLEVVDSSKAQLLVVVNHAWDEEKRDKVALLTFVELHIPGVELHIPGELGVASSSDPSVRRVIVVWRDRNLELVPTADAHEAILNSLASSLERFNWARRTANGGDNDD